MVRRKTSITNGEDLPWGGEITRLGNERGFREVEVDLQKRRGGRENSLGSLVGKLNN